MAKETQEAVWLERVVVLDEQINELILERYHIIQLLNGEVKNDKRNNI